MKIIPKISIIEISNYLNNTDNPREKRMKICNIIHNIFIQELKMNEYEYLYFSYEKILSLFPANQLLEIMLIYHNQR